MLFTSPTSEQSSWSGPVDFYYETFLPDCGGFTGQISASGDELSGTGDQSDNGCTTGAANYFTGTITPGQSMTLTDSAGSTIIWTFDSLYLKPSSLALVTGAWALSNVGVLNIGPDGAIGVTGLSDDYDGCSVTGQVSVLDPQFNLYGFTLSWACQSGPNENGQVWTGFLALDGSQLIGGGVVNSGSGGAFNQALIAVANQP